MWKKLIETNDDVVALVLRLALGIVMLPHGAQKLLGWFSGRGFSGTIELFSQLGFPTIIAVLVIIGESFGSLGLLIGFLTRIAAVGIGIIMLGAMLFVHWQYGFFMKWGSAQGGEGFEFHILAIGLALGLVILGGGKWSVDRSLTQKL